MRVVHKLTQIKMLTAPYKLINATGWRGYQNILSVQFHQLENWNRRFRLRSLYIRFAIFDGKQATWVDLINLDIYG